MAVLMSTGGKVSEQSCMSSDGDPNYDFWTAFEATLRGVDFALEVCTRFEEGDFSRFEEGVYFGHLLEVSLRTNICGYVEGTLVAKKLRERAQGIIFANGALSWR